MVCILKGESDDEGGDGYGRCGEPDDDEAGFGLDAARVPTRVVGADGVVQPVT